MNLLCYFLVSKNHNCPNFSLLDFPKMVFDQKPWNDQNDKKSLLFDESGLGSRMSAVSKLQGKQPFTILKIS